MIELERLRIPSGAALFVSSAATAADKALGSPRFGHAVSDTKKERADIHPEKAICPIAWMR
ncbi:hypothetical protein [Sphingomonas alpina]|uniref:Uncharacterized protein n=1 Tax=Sphingomonas alpina TaxID=653931 RepID=A0A7H0LLP7_9SPHN|nr:hypothetical protein [Sphingomonas alpina]QNQ10600.1 hypothetical protein H3Z74_05190 [Sphingomonas alpina]